MIKVALMREDFSFFNIFKKMPESIVDKVDEFFSHRDWYLIQVVENGEEWVKNVIFLNV